MNFIDTGDGVLFACIAILAGMFLWHLFSARGERKKLIEALAWARADAGSLKAMYGPNKMSVMPDINGTVSETVLIDTQGANMAWDFELGNFNQITDAWEVQHGATHGPYRLPPEDLDRAVWYRLPLNKYEEQRNKRD